MTKLLWDKVGDRTYETGIDRGVLYLPDGGVAWNGLTAVDEQFKDDATEPYYLDGVKYLDSQVTGDYAAVLKALTYPDEFLEYEGTVHMSHGMYVDGQPLKPFNLSYRSRIGNDLKGTELGYKIHLLYNLLAVPNDLSYSSISSKTTGLEFSWTLSSIPEKLAGYRPTAHVIIDSRYIDPDYLKILENIIYGTVKADASLPSLTDVLAFVTTGNIITVVDNGNGTWTASTLGDYITMTDDTTFIITDIDAIYVDDETYIISTTNVPEGG